MDCGPYLVGHDFNVMGPLEFVVDKNAKIMYYLTMFDWVPSEGVIDCDGHNGRSHKVFRSLGIERDEFHLVRVSLES